ncbi:MAG: signal peptidase II [Firmicutes bacterium]|nr:signal peptidase II [Bacillota bacterium]
MKVYILTFTILALDQILKWLVVRNMQLHQSLPVIKGIFHLTYVHNFGAAFSLFANYPVLLTLVALLIVLLLLIFLAKLPQQERLLRLALAIILGGALGNLLDRLRLGYVIDFLDFRIWPVFNLADMAIVLGVGLLFWAMTKMPQEKGI